MDYSIVNFIEGAMVLLIGLLLVINLAMYIMKLSRNTTMMFIAVLGLMVINIANILTPVRFDLGFENQEDTIDRYSNDLTHGRLDDHNEVQDHQIGNDAVQYQILFQRHQGCRRTDR